MITIKKYPNRRLYNTSTSSYINLDGIQQLILKGETVAIVDSKTNENVTTATLLLHALDTNIIEALIPSGWMQDLMRMNDNAERLLAIETYSSTDIGVPEPESETQAAEKTIPRENPVQLSDVPDSNVHDSNVHDEVSMEIESESSDSSESEITVVRIKPPPTEPFDGPTCETNETSEQELGDAFTIHPETLDDGIPSFWSEPGMEVVLLKEDDTPDNDDLEHDSSATIGGRQLDAVDEPVDEYCSDEASSSSESESSQSSAESQEVDLLDVNLPPKQNTVDTDLDHVDRVEKVDVSPNAVSDEEDMSVDSRPSVVASNPVVSTSGDQASAKSQRMAERLAAMRAKLKR